LLLTTKLPDHQTNLAVFCVTVYNFAPGGGLHELIRLPSFRKIVVVGQAAVIYVGGLHELIRLPPFRKIVVVGEDESSWQIVEK
jgi:hypothetical protein